jgi:hypothetical protein
VPITVKVEHAGEPPAPVAYRWDTDTAILTAHFTVPEGGTGLTGSVELAGNDGSWVILDVAGGRVRGVEIAVWPDIRRRADLRAPAEVQTARVMIPARKAQPGVAVVQVDAALSVDADDAERTIHFRMDGMRAARTLRIAREILLDVDEFDKLCGFWLLDVPSLPAAS